MSFEKQAVEAWEKIDELEKENHRLRVALEAIMKHLEGISNEVYDAWKEECDE